MTAETRRNIFRYGIAIDLVIVAIGAGMLLSESPALLLTFFAAAVLLSTWKGGWQGGLTALVLSVIALAAVFSSGAKSLALFAVATGAAAAALHTLLHARVSSPGREAQAPSLFPGQLPVSGEAVAEPVPVDRERALVEEERAAAERARQEAEERAVAERARREAETHAARERAEAERERAQLEAARKEAEEQAAREREEAQREAERLEVERAEAERVEAERAAREREEAARALQERLDLERVEAERLRKEAEARAVREHEEAARALQERHDLERAEAERLRREAEERTAREREEAERERARLETARREAEERAAREREEAEREKARLEAARQEAEQRAAREKEEAERALQARMEAERVAAEERVRQELEREREAMRIQLEEALAADRENLAKATAAAADSVNAKPAPAPKPSLLETMTSWFRREPRPHAVNVNMKRVSANGTATKRPQPPATARRNAAAAKVRKPRLVLLERRRGTAETVVPKLRQRGLEVSIVERWVDAADEMLRMKPDAFFLDVDHPDFDVVLKTTLEKNANLPIILTGRSSAAAPGVRYAAFVARPYDAEEVWRIAQQAMTKPEDLLALQLVPRVVAPKPVPVAGVTTPGPPAGIRREPPRPAPVVAAPLPQAKPSVAQATSSDEYEVSCFTCRVEFNAVEADWCSCLAKERSLVCTNCLSCFCKAPPAFKEKFWLEAPSKLFERKTAEARKQLAGLPENAPAPDVVRPLVLAVEDDEDIQAIVQRVCTNLGYGFVHADNGQTGLEVARTYRPNLILSDAFMPRLDGREMCRLLREDPEFADTRMVVMTGLYTDTKYRSEALKRFKVDDYIAKPVSITDLINLLQKHLEGVSGLPAPEDLHELHRKAIPAELDEEDDGVSLAEVLAQEPEELPAVPEVRAAAPVKHGYEVSCFNCDQTFDASHADWCRCVGRDNTLVCSHCSGCFCKAPAPYKERFWIDAPPTLFERKMIGSKRNTGARANPSATDVKRPLILLVEDDENVQLIVRTVVTTMGYGFVVGSNGQEGLTLAREYAPELILSDAFMPKLDGREMCRLLKEDPTTSRSKAIIMTGLYTDRKYRNEALDYFKVDDYVAKPLAVDDLIKLFKKHLPHEVATAH